MSIQFTLNESFKQRSTSKSHDESNKKDKLSPKNEIYNKDFIQDSPENYSNPILDNYKEEFIQQFDNCIWEINPMDFN